MRALAHDSRQEAAAFRTHRWSCPHNPRLVNQPPVLGPPPFCLCLSRAEQPADQFIERIELRLEAQLRSDLAGFVAQLIDRGFALVADQSIEPSFDFLAFEGAARPPAPRARGAHVLKVARAVEAKRPPPINGRSLSSDAGPLRGRKSKPGSCVSRFLC